MKSHQLVAIAGLGAVALAAVVYGTWTPLSPRDSSSTDLASLGPVHGGVVSAASGQGRQSLSELRILSVVFDNIVAQYVVPERVDWERILDASLDSVELRVPEALFQRQPGGDILSVQVGEHRTALHAPAPNSRREAEDVLRQVAEILAVQLDPNGIPTSDAREPRPYAEVEYALINGALSTLDPHSHVYPPEDSKEMDVENQGHFGGLGVTIVSRDGRLVVEYPQKDTPAMRAGLQTSDVITRIDGESTMNMSLNQAVRRLRGPEGSSVLLLVERPGEERPFEVFVERARIALNPVEGQLLEGNVAYLQISSFHAQVAQELDDELARLTDEAGKLEGVVLDLRGNPGGFLKQAELVANTFLSSGVILSTTHGSGKYGAPVRAINMGTQPDYPMVVLMNARSASASEIVAGALRNNERAVIVGERSFGKGSVQNLKNLEDESKLKITTQLYLTPGEQSIQGVGIPADIELEPTVVTSRNVAGAPVSWVAVHHRERATREADLYQSLDRRDFRVQEPSYRARYIVQDGKARTSTGELDLSHDVEVNFARDLILAAPSARRAEILAVAEPVVLSHASDWDAQIIAAFKDIGVDWTDGPVPSKVDLDVKVTVSDDETLNAGVPESWTVSVTNRGSSTLHRLVAVSSAEVDALDGREFVLGRLAPGQTRTWTQHVTLVDGYPTEQVPVTLELRSGEHPSLQTVKTDIHTLGRPLPEFAWSWTAEDADGDGIITQGESFDLVLELTNVGTGASREAWARAENRSGVQLDLLTPSLAPGFWRTPSGEPCEVPKNETSTESCFRELAAGETWTGRFEMVARGDVPAVDVRVGLGDAAAYDHAATMRAGFYSFASQQDDLSIAVGTPFVAPAKRAPPIVTLGSKPALHGIDTFVTVSGMVNDPDGLEYLLVFSGDNKVFQHGGRHAELKQVPFTADVALKPGANTISILARDKQGVTTAKSVVTWLEVAEVQAMAD